jgi:hypothetical protein
MNIAKVWKDWIVPVIVGVIASAIYEAIRRVPSIVSVPHLNDAQLGSLFRLCFFIALTFLLVYVGRMLERHEVALPIPGLSGPSQSKQFVLEVAGSQPLDSQSSEWRFFITNCTTQILRSVELGTIRSEIGAFEICFNEITVIQPGQKVQLTYEIYSRRAADVLKQKKATLWDFGEDHSWGGRGTTYFWYDIPIRYRIGDGNSFHDGGVVGVCFDLHNKLLKVEGAELYRGDRRF